MTIEEITNLTLIETIDNIKEGKLTKEEVYDAYLKNIHEKDEKIGAYLEVIEDGKKNIPIAIKDNINVIGTKTTCASNILSNYVSPYDATVIKKLKENDFSVIGKVNMDEFAMGVSTEFSALKETSNPHDLNKVPGGSSGGSAAAVAGNMAPCALGTDTGGSVRQPAAYCGVVGFKPSYGMISRYGVTAFSSSFDQVGTITKDVKDSAYLLNILQGREDDVREDTTAIEKTNEDYLEGIENDISNMKIGVFGNILDNMQEEISESIKNAKGILEKLGCKVEYITLHLGKEVISVYHIISSAEASSNLSRFDTVRFGKRSENIESLDDLYLNGRTEGFGPEVKKRILLGTYVLSAGYYDAYYVKALKVKQKITNELNEIFKEYDAILMPVTTHTAPEKGHALANKEETFYSDIYTSLANIIGAPAISIPGYYDSDNMPIGIGLMAKRYDDKKLLNIANVLFENIAKENN